MPPPSVDRRTVSSVESVSLLGEVKVPEEMPNLERLGHAKALWQKEVRHEAEWFDLLELVS